METGPAEVEAAEAFGVDLVQPFEFDWVDHSFTNFCGADSFIGRLDYILPDRRSLRVASVAPMPGVEEAAMDAKAANVRICPTMRKNRGAMMQPIMKPIK